MPQDRIDSLVTAASRQADPSRIASKGGWYRNGTILRVGKRTTTETASYWDVELRDVDFKTIDLNFRDDFDNDSREVHPIIANVAAPTSASVAVGDSVTVLVSAQGTVSARDGYPYETLAAAYDVTVVNSGLGCSLVTSNGADAGGLLLNWKDWTSGGLVDSAD